MSRLLRHTRISELFPELHVEMGMEQSTSLAGATLGSMTISAEP
jgi:hypothetical protein